MDVINVEDLFLDRAKFVMKLLGVWMPPEKESITQKIYRMFMMGLQFIFLLFQFIYIIQMWGDLDAVSQASYVLFTQACLCFKVTVFQLKTPVLRDLLDRLNGEVFKPQCEKHVKMLEFQATRIKRLLLSFLISAQITCGLWALKPLFDDAGSRKFPFDMWMPLGPENSVHYIFGFSFQLLTISMSAIMYFGVDSVVLSMVIFSCGQVDIIKDKIMRVEPTWDKRKTELRHVQSENYKILIECIVHYQAVAAFIEQVENGYHSYLLFQLSGSVGLICMSALRILIVDPSSMQFYSILTYLSVMISQLFVCCWCGHELTATSDDLHTVIYKCAWYEQDIRFKRALNFAMMRTIRPLLFRAGHYIELSRQTFVAILRMSYSYFAVLKQTNH